MPRFKRRPDREPAVCTGRAAAGCGTVVAMTVVAGLAHKWRWACWFFWGAV